MESVKFMMVVMMSVLGLTAGSGIGQVQDVNEVLKIAASDGLSSDRFGNSIAVQGNVCVVGAALDDTIGGIDSGSAYVYRFDGVNWNEEQQLLASDGSPGYVFGTAVGIDGNVIVVGAFGGHAGLETGSVYIFRYDGTSWIQEAQLFASDAAAGTDFGIAIAINGNVCVVGSETDSTVAFHDGSAYVFRFDGTNWNEEAQLLASDPGNRDHFGTAVSVQGNVCVVGALYDNTTGGVDAGSAYVFRYNGTNWIEEDHLFASDGQAIDVFGVSVDIQNDLIAVGAYGGVGMGGTSPGSVYLYRFNGINWIEDVKILASDGEPGDGFGFSTSISGTTLVIGSLFDNTINGVDVGSAYVYLFDGTQWVEQQHLFASDGQAGNRVGNAVSTDGTSIMVGAGFGNGMNGALNTGAGYFFIFDCNGNGIPDNMDIINGTSVDCNGNALPDECDIASGFSLDCNGNGLPDSCDILSGTSQDIDGNGTPDECECLADISPIFTDGTYGNGIVNIDDLVFVLNSFGQSTSPGQPTNIGDTNFNGVVNIDDLVAVLNAFGGCP